MGKGSTLMEQKNCKKHPAHKLSKGVCPSCLREKLSHLSTSSSSTSSLANLSSSSASSSLSPSYSSDESGGGSPRHDHKNMMVKNKSFSSCLLTKDMIIGSKVPNMKKSRSLAFVVVEEEEKESKKKKKKKKGMFWAKLFGGRREEDKGGVVLKSKTMKVRSASNKWALFS